ncbi:helix-turn-helix domain-containing protein [Leucobacter viscericola]|uniref:Helix-turn-helix domain-containing protein n=1 Tax=Leucobacter viscericola TaxID=2714935 RepID=A0A6G7XCT2_9MICO|nr:helix-turn-helix transcriptional regulator [Leucobacter viscericola]QIK62312.1 helix-turn-helix domain-containing protein [Leucobacter viscericola]
MASGTEGAADGLALEFVKFIRTQAVVRGWRVDDIAEGIGMSKNYAAKRLRGEGLFNLRDVERLSNMLGLSPVEVFARVEYSFAGNYEGRLVPTYGIRGDKNGIQVLRVDDADPPAFDALIEYEGEAPSSVFVGGGGEYVGKNDDSRKQQDYGLVANRITEDDETGEDVDTI